MTEELVLAEGRALPGAIQNEYVHAPGYIDRYVCMFPAAQSGTYEVGAVVDVEGGEDDVVERIGVRRVDAR